MNAQGKVVCTALTHDSDEEQSARRTPAQAVPAISQVAAQEHAVCEGATFQVL